MASRFMRCVCTVGVVISLLFLLNILRSFTNTSKQRRTLGEKRESQGILYDGHQQASRPEFDPGDKVILYHSAPEFFRRYNGKNFFKSCQVKVSNCYFTTDNKHLGNSHAVIFRHYALPKDPPTRKVGQIWVFTSSEPPVRETLAQPWKGTFNWTMSYRRHSDFYFGYGDVIPRRKSINRDYKKIFSEKEKDVAWIVSHCDTWSKREVYANELKKHINVDTYGGCGDKKCQAVYKGFENDSCHDTIGRKYKFYLSFENSICKDYTTEKFYFPFAFDKPIVSVARGAYNTKDSVPSEAFIDTSDFASPKDLALHLKKIGGNEEEYIKLLKKKDKYESKTSPETFEDAVCKMCAALHEERSAKIVDIPEVMFKNQCREPSDLNNSTARKDRGKKT
ncbi:hypothetical protein FSP39_001914 [Pinctada imbricata]|uniref:Fucosyltransferase n=1 Tax=Pinctada imbricata TaxID=66713 RepID=A0AA88YML4_PINIB|nr:hypothetical protein FSP39_001914 [Pinctada imbricata]